MRHLVVWMVGLMMVVGFAINLPNVRADSQFINGTLKTDDDVPVAYDEITLTNLNTSESIYTQSGANGQFSFNLDNLQSGYSTGNVIQIWPCPVDGYQGYEYCLVIRAPCFIDNVYTVNPVMHLDPPDETMEDIVGVMWVHDHNHLNPGFGQEWWRKDETVTVPSGFSYVETRVGWLYWDDARTGYNNGENYQVQIDLGYELWLSGTYPQGSSVAAVSYQAIYFVTGGGAQKQLDPFMTLTIDMGLHKQSLLLKMTLSITTFHFENNVWVQISQDGEYFTTSDGLVYDFTFT